MRRPYLIAAFLVSFVGGAGVALRPPTGPSTTEAAGTWTVFSDDEVCVDWCTCTCAPGPTCSAAVEGTGCDTSSDTFCHTFPHLGHFEIFQCVAN